MREGEGKRTPFGARWKVEDWRARREWKPEEGVTDVDRIAEFDGGVVGDCGQHRRAAGADARFRLVRLETESIDGQQGGRPGVGKN